MNRFHQMAWFSVATALSVGCADETVVKSPETTVTTTAATPPDVPPPLPAGANLPTAVAPTVAPSAPSAPEDAHLTDGQIAGIASRIDLAEVDAGKLALAQGKSATVRQFAQHMISAHGSVESKLTALMKKQGISSEESAVCDTLTRDTAAQKQALMGQGGFDFDRAYLKAQLKDHRDVLQLFDTKLLPEVQNPELRAALQATREKVVMHIKMAEDALAALPAQ
jgi:putative membrane protein